MINGQTIFILARLRVLDKPSDNPAWACIAAFFAPKLAREDSLVIAHRILTVVRIPENAMAIRAELSYLDGRYRHPRAAKQVLGEKWPDRPAPFLSTVILGALALPIEWQSFIASVGFLPASHIPEPTTAGNLVIDITDPSNPSYCFAVSDPRRKRQPRWTCPESQPISALQYLGHYRPEILRYQIPACTIKHDYPAVDPANGRKAEALISYFCPCIPLVEHQALSEAWAPPQKPTRSRDSFDSQSIPIRDKIRILVFQAIHSGDSRALSDMGWNREIIECLQDTLANLDSIPQGGIPLLIESFRLTAPDGIVKSLDLAPYPLLPHQASVVIQAFKNTVQMLNLSGHSWVGRQAVGSLRIVAPHLSRLMILGCDGIRASELDMMERDGLLRGYEVFLHSQLQARSLRMAAVPRAQFSVIVRHGNEWVPSSNVCAISLDVLHPRSIFQGLRLLLREFTKSPSIHRQVFDSTIFLPSCFAGYPPLGGAHDEPSLDSIDAYINLEHGTFVKKEDKGAAGLDEYLHWTDPIATLPSAYSHAPSAGEWIFVLNARHNVMKQRGDEDDARPDIRFGFLRVLNDGGYDVKSLRGFMEEILLHGPKQERDRIRAELPRRDVYDAVDSQLESQGFRMMQEADAENFMAAFDESVLGDERNVKRRKFYK